MSERLKEKPTAAPLVEVTRGSITESRHRGHAVAVDASGRVRAYLGTPETVTFLRSSAKPFQSIPLIATGAAKRFGFNQEELALACASHSGEPHHVEIVSGMLEKIGLDESALKCGVHVPFNQDVARALIERGERPSVLQNNCSGKHVGMLALALHIGAPTETYIQPDNPVQLLIRRTIAQFSDVPLDNLALGIDGCSAPTFGMSISAMALMYARLVAPPTEFDEATRDACSLIVAAMTAYPEVVGGRAERLDSKVMRAANGRLVSKIGAEGVYTAGLLPMEEFPQGLGFALKIEDGEERRARPVVVIESLHQLGLLDQEALETLALYASFAVRNHRGEQVGEVRACFTLKGGS